MNYGMELVGQKTADLNEDKRAAGGVGTSTAALCFGGQPGKDSTEVWNGTSWTEVNNLNQERFGLAGSGSTTAALAFAGSPVPPLAFITNTEDWNGVSWVETTDVSVGRRYLAGSTNGSSTAALAFGGLTPSASASTEVWSGTSETV